MNNQGKKTCVTIGETQDSSSSWINRPYLTDRLREQLQKANVLIVPTEGFREQKKLVFFPDGTLEMYHFLRESQDERLNIEICIEDNDFKELALHHDTAEIAKFIVTLVAAPLIVALIAGYINRKFDRKRRDAIIKSEVLIYNEKNGEAKRLYYEGPANEYHAVMSKAVKKVDEMIQTRQSPKRVIKKNIGTKKE